MPQPKTRPQITALPPGTHILTIDSQLSPTGEIHFSSEPAFVLVHDTHGSSVLGLLDHEIPLGEHGPHRKRVANTLVPPGIEQNDLQGFVLGTYNQLFAPDPPLAPPSEPPEAPRDGPVPDVPDFLASREGAPDAAEAPTEVLDPVTTYERPPPRVKAPAPPSRTLPDGR